MRRVLIALVLMSTVAAAPVLAQSEAVTLRVGKLEKEMRAVQRKVFPDGAQLEPELGGSSDTPGTSGGTSAIVDLTARVDALESQLKSLTGQMETQANRLSKVEAANKAMDARIKAVEPKIEDSDDTNGTPDLPVAPKPVAVAPKPIAPKPEVEKPVPPKTALKTPTVTPSKPASATKTDPKLKSKIDAVEIPRTGDAAEDTYSYGYRLWQAKLYPEAQEKLRAFGIKYPKHKRASYAQNLLGRAYLDEGKPALASVAFYENYTKNPKGERAPESLYLLGTALTKLKKLPDACKAYAEFGDAYGATASADLKARVAKGRTDAKCSA
jgi:TolA-binding protein